MLIYTHTGGTTCSLYTHTQTAILNNNTKSEKKGEKKENPGLIFYFFFFFFRETKFSCQGNELINKNNRE